MKASAHPLHLRQVLLGGATHLMLALGFLLLVGTAVQVHAADRVSALPTRHPPAFAAPTVSTTDVSGNINTPTTWLLAASPYVVTGDIYISPGITLTIEAGVVVKFQQVSGQISVDGALVARGSAQQTIIFTSYKDDSAGGDTNGDGAATAPAPGDWNWLVFNQSSASILEHVVVRYGGYYYGTSVEVATANITLADSTLAYAKQTGIHFQGAMPPLLARNQFVGNGGAAASMTMSSAPAITLDGNQATGNGINGFVVSTQVNGDLTWDGDPALPFVVENLGVTKGARLTLSPGDIFKFLNQDGAMGIAGTIVARGTAQAPIYFTSLRDDAAGGDTNGDGAATAPAPGDWNNLRFEYAAPISGNVLEHVVVRYGGHTWHENIWVDNTDLIMLHAASTDADGAGLSMNGALVWVRDTAFMTNHVGVWVVGNVNLVVTGSRLANNRDFGIQNTSSSRVVDARHNWWGDASGPYHAMLNPAGTGNAVSDGVLILPWLATPDPGTGTVGRLLVGIDGPKQISPGQSASYAVSHANLTDEILENAVLVATLPGSMQYLDSTGGGIYWPQRMQVFWRLGNLAPDASGVLAFQGRYLWGTPDNLVDAATVLLSGTSLGDSTFDLQPYLAYTPVTVTGSTPLSPEQVQAERQTYPALDQLYSQAESAGFILGDAGRLSLSSGEPMTLLTFMALPRGEVKYLHRQGDQVLAETYGSVHLTLEDATGGLRTDLETFEVEYFGAWSPALAAAQHLVEITAGVCLRNCLIAQLGDSSWAVQVLQMLAMLKTLPACVECSQGIGLACRACGANLAAAQSSVGIVSLSANLDVCGIDCGDPKRRPAHACVAGQSINSCATTWLGPVDFGALTAGRSELSGRMMTFTCSESTGEWVRNGFSFCDIAAGEVCFPWVKNGQGLPCLPCRSASVPLHASAVSPQVNHAQGSARLCSDSDNGGMQCVATDTRVRAGRDPNAKIGLGGDLLPGQTVTYTITYENEGAGRAYGVYILDEVSEHFDDSTVVIVGPGQYIGNSRTLYWNVGELAPKGEPGSTGAVTFTVALKPGLVAGTVITNQAVVYFPSVPETTPTNAVVNLIQPVAATPQTVETQAGQAVNIHLSGRDAGNAPLTFAVVTQPLAGALSGTEPDLVYSPPANFSGQDLFTFRASNGSTHSGPAEVTILVHPSSTDSIAPSVLWTEPLDHIQQQAVSTEPLLTDDSGSLYAPAIMAQLSEALEATTVTSQTVAVQNGQGRTLAVTVDWVPGVNQISIRLREPLETGTTYTVRFTTGIHDLNGNGLPTVYQWSFRTTGETHQQSLLLPLVTK